MPKHFALAHAPCVLINQSINQAINQSTIQPINQSINQSTVWFAQAGLGVLVRQECV